MRKVRTDLARESFDAVGDAGAPGVHVSDWEEADVRVTEVIIETEAAAQQLGKPRGTYITLEIPALKTRDPEARLGVSALLGEEISRLLPPDETGQTTLVLGLGNRLVTPDSLGPRAIDGTLVTRHMFETLPEAIDEDMSSVCAVAPGVMGVTGVETMEMARAVTQIVRPRCVIVMDSLAARAVSRLGSTVQISDAGIQPGSGVANHRQALTRETLGVPVIAIGVPTVVYASTIVADALDEITGTAANGAAEDAEGIERMLDKIGGMIVTPREIDSVVAQAAEILAMGVNRALHPGLSPAELGQMAHS